MAAFEVITSCNIGQAQSGNSQFLYIQVSVTHAGKPATGLSKQQVTFRALTVGPNGYDIVWNPNPHGYWENAPGYYLVDVIPANNGTWSKGTWVVAIIVADGNNHGQSLASFTIP